MNRNANLAACTSPREADYVGRLEMTMSGKISRCKRLELELARKAES